MVDVTGARWSGPHGAPDVFLNAFTVAGDGTVHASGKMFDGGLTTVTTLLFSQEGNFTGATPIAVTVTAGAFAFDLATNPGTGQWYGQAVAVNAAGTAYSQIRMLTVADTVPGAPTTVAGSQASAQSSISWTAPAVTGGAPITGYTIVGYKVSDDTVVASHTNATSPYVFTGLTNGTGYYFKVAATNTSGTGVQSAASATVTPA